jgi:hypothetical protein
LFNWDLSAGKYSLRKTGFVGREVSWIVHVIPEAGASLVQWQNYLNGLLTEDQRRPDIAIAVRRARQHMTTLQKDLPQQEILNQRK